MSSANILPQHRNRRKLIAKRIFDISVSGLSLLIFSPFLILIAFLVRIKLGSPVLFRQIRPGLHGEPFTIYKFRTMTDEKDDKGELLPDEERLTSFGQFLRRLSLDELPELINVLKGNMSIVGPRPLRMYYLDRYSLEQARRHEVKPGITGWAQINGRNLLTWDEKFQLDVWYVDNWTIWLDIRIILRTLVMVIKREGISAEGHATMPEFMGSEKGGDD